MLWGMNGHHLKAATRLRSGLGVVLILLGLVGAPLCHCADENEAVAAEATPADVHAGAAGIQAVGRECPCDERDCPELTATEPSSGAQTILGSAPSFGPVAVVPSLMIRVPDPAFLSAPGHDRDIGPPIPGDRFRILRL
jgi:hypothetical protein